MNKPDNTATNALLGQNPEATELLRRILSAVEPAKTRHGFEIACAIVLALATTASAWCANPLPALAVLLLLGTVMALTTMPICHE